jgi:hypothetical protein
MNKIHENNTKRIWKAHEELAGSSIICSPTQTNYVIKIYVQSCGERNNERRYLGFTDID